ncbi:uncharacterized protein FYW61_012058 [Anableps anableps]
MVSGLLMAGPNAELHRDSWTSSSSNRPKQAPGRRRPGRVYAGIVTEQRLETALAMSAEEEEEDEEEEGPGASPGPLAVVSSVGQRLTRTAQKVLFSWRAIHPSSNRPSIQMSEQPPPYRPFFPEGPPPSTFSPAFYSPSTTFPGSTYQTFPQSSPAPDQTIFQPGPAGQQGGSVMPPGYYGDHRGNQHESHPAKPTVLVMEQRRRQPAGGGASYLAACSAALCCCCLWDLLHR